MTDIERFAFADLDGMFLVVNRREAEAMLAWLRNMDEDDPEDLTSAFRSMRDQLEEFIGDE